MSRTYALLRSGTRAARTALAIASLALVPLFAHASLPGNRPLAPRPVAPAAGAVVEERAVRLAWEPPPHTARHLVVWSRAPFDPSGLTGLPEDPALTVREVAHPVVSLDALGLTLEADADLFWAPASIERGTGRVAFGPVQRQRVLRRFSNRVAPSPYLVEGSVGAVRPRAETEDASGRATIRLSSGHAFEPGTGEPAIPAALRAPAEPGGSRTVLVHYGDADPERARAAILAAGGRVVSYIPDHTFLVRFLAGARKTVRLGGESLRSFDFHPAYRVSPRLALAADASGTIDLLAFQDGDLAAIEAEAAKLGATTLARSDNGINKILRLALTGEAATALAGHPDVAWIEPHTPLELHNEAAQWVVQTGQNANRRLWTMGLRGQNQIVCTTDSGIDMSHVMFNDPLVPVIGFGHYPTHRKVVAYLLGSDNPAVEFGDHAGAAFHGTHTAGTVAGNDAPTGGANPYDGMAPDAKLFFMDLSGTSMLNGVAAFADLNDLFQPSYDGNAAGAARISSNSWGAAVNGAYNLNSLAVDQFMWAHPDYLIFISNGNSGPGGKVGAPASAKSSVGAGGTQNGTSAHNIYNSTSRGPTVDGRRKPTICSPGQQVISSVAGPSGYAPLSGTSMASPSMTGAATLIRQYLTDGWYPTGAPVAANGFAPSAALLKAMCINAADNALPAFTAPDQNVGYGRLNADNVCYFAGDSRKLLLVDHTTGLGHGQAIEYQIQVVDNSIPLEVSLCWTDFPGDLAAAVQLVNNLDLTVTNGVTTYKGNVYAAGASTTGGSYDNRNVEEAVLVQNPTAGLWTVRIEGVNVPVGPQGFGLCVTGGVGNGAGTLALDRASYGSTSTVELEVIDTNAAGPLTVTMSSPSEPAGESVTLTGANGVFTGSIVLTPAAAGADGALSVAHGDLITATYADAAPVATLAATATVSFRTPVITNVRALNQGNGGVLVTWDTDLNATSKVYFGATPALGEASATDPAAVRPHAVLLPGLVRDQTYYYDVESVDLTGNVTRDDNGGAHYRFTVSPPADVLLVYGGKAFEREPRYTDAFTTLGWSFDIWKGPLSDVPALGDATGGLRGYKAVWWQPGLEHYPALSDVARDSVTAYLAGGGRLALTSHDVVWGLADPSSPYFSLDRKDWIENTLRVTFNTDPAGWTGLTGIAGDVVSGPYTAGVAYAEHRSGASGDEIDYNPGGGTFPITGGLNWLSGEATPDHCGVRWESDAPLGGAGDGVWGGHTSRFVGMFYEWTSIQPTATVSSAIRNDILHRTLVWLTGHERPTVTVTSPNGGEVVTGTTVNIAWTESTPAGVGIASRAVDYSLDGGASWVTLATPASSGPVAWDVSAVPNSGQVLVRVRVVDDTHPFLSASDASDAVFSLERPGGDTVGPTVVAGSVGASPNPIHNQQSATLTASITETGAGGGTVAAAEWSEGLAPEAPGAGAPMTGAFGATTVAVSGTIAPNTINPGARTLWVRGRDAAGNWGPARSFQVQVNGQPVVGVDDAPLALALHQNAPNPVSGATEIVFALPAAGRVSLAIFDTQGRRVVELARGAHAAGRHRVRWNAVDADGRAVSPGIYYYRLETGDHTLERRMAILR